MTAIARDYASAVSLIAANPKAHFSVDADGAIHQESRIKTFFGHRDVTQQKMDTAVGEALLQMYETALSHPTEGSTTLALVAPRQLDVVARFIRAYDQSRASAQHTRQKPLAPLTGRSVTVTLHEPTDAGSKHLQSFQKVLSANGMAPGDMVDHVQRLQKTAAGFSPAALKAFNDFSLGGGNLIFRVLFNHPECTDPALSTEERHARYQICAKPYVEAAKAKLAQSEGAFVQARIAEGSSPEDAQSDWDLKWASTSMMLDINGNLHHQLSSGADCLADLGRYIAEAKNQSLTEDQAMTPIRVWMDGNPETLESIWQAKPDEVPALAEIALVARLIEKGIPLSDEQAQMAMQYFPPKSS